MAGLLTSRRGAWAGLATYAVAWGASAYALYAGGSEDFQSAIVILPVYGVVFSVVAWIATLGQAAAPLPVRRPRLELTAVLVYLGLYAVLFTGVGLNVFHAAFPSTTDRMGAALLIAIKLVVHVGLPFALLAALGGRPGSLFTARANARGFWLCLVLIGGCGVAFMALVSPAFRNIAALGLPPGELAVATLGATLWLAIEAGLCEEYLFRAVLQTRLAAVLQSEAGAVFLAALLFALAHVPGLYLRAGADVSGHSASLVQVIAYAIAVLSPIGVSLGFVWARTRSLLLVVLIHALVDVTPQIPQFVKTWM
jgi:membrane protease YdiL (CAAX protease family)